MTVEVDLVVLSTGSAAQNVAFPCRAAGRSVAIVDSDPFGGTCQLRGCDPKKVLVGVSELVDWGRRMQGKGAPAPASTLTWPELIRFERTFIDGVPAAVEQSLKDTGMLTVHGRARFVDTTTLRVGDETYTGEHVVIATGARHAPLEISGEEHLTTSTGFLGLDELPRRVAFVGGGYIAFEFAHVVARAGAEVSILHRGERPLPRFDPDLVNQLLETTRELGVDVQVRTPVTGVEPVADGLVVHAGTDEETIDVAADLVVHAAGRIPEIDDLDVGAAGVVRDEKGGIAVNDYLQSVSNPSVYAAGDAVTGGLPLTPVAGMQGRIVAANLLHGNTQMPNYRGVPTVVFTAPPLARVGLNEAEAQAQGLDFSTRHRDTSQWYTSRRVGLAHTGFKTLVEHDTGRILGAHLLGPQAEEIINIFALAIRSGLNAHDLNEMVFAYPTGASDIRDMV